MLMVITVNHYVRLAVVPLGHQQPPCGLSRRFATRRDASRRDASRRCALHRAAPQRNATFLYMAMYKPAHRYTALCYASQRIASRRNAPLHCATHRSSPHHFAAQRFATSHVNDRRSNDTYHS